MRFFILILMLCCLGLQYTLWFGNDGYRKLDQLNAQLVKQKQHNQFLLARNQAMRAEIQDMQQGVTALEERARGEFGMIGQKEILVQVLPHHQKIANNQTQLPEQAQLANQKGVGQSSSSK